jgi:hypothetical protein
MVQPLGPAAVLALIPLLALTACAAPAPHSTEATKEPDMTSSASCTHSGSYRIIPSANGSFPLLPVSARGADSTPLVRLSSTHLKYSPPAADVSVALFASGTPATQEFPGLTVGQEATFDGYTIKITSICDGEVLFDVVAQPD